MKKSNNDFGALKDLRDQLKKRSLQEQLEEKKRKEDEHAAHKDAAIFRSGVGDVTRIKTPDTYSAPTKVVPATKRKEISTMSEVMQEMEQWSDDFVDSQDWESSYAIKGSNPDLLKNLRKGQWPPQAFLDLHGMQRDQARTALAEFLRRAKHERLRCICVIHGKGINSRETAVLPTKVRSWLSQSELVQAFCPAKPQDGGEGALYVLLLTKN